MIRSDCDTADDTGQYEQQRPQGPTGFRTPAQAHGFISAARLAFELGTAVRGLREERGWSQTRLAQAAGMTQSAVARFEAGGTVPTPPVLERLARALDVELAVRFTPRTTAASPRRKPDV